MRYRARLVTRIGVSTPVSGVQRARAVPSHRRSVAMRMATLALAAAALAGCQSMGAATVERTRLVTCTALPIVSATRPHAGINERLVVIAATTAAGCHGRTPNARPQ